PAALNEDTVTGKAFMELAENVIQQVERMKKNGLE
ncbi:Iron-sulfur cluster carrier protein, partial [termite gut metagenome]